MNRRPKHDPNRSVTLMLALATLGAACDRNVLHTGTVVPGKPVAPSTPIPVHQDGTCDPGLVACAGVSAGFCFNLQDAPDHCGACGNACSPGIPCENGQCRVVPCTERITVKAMRVDYSFGYRYQIALADFDRDGALDMLAPTPAALWAIDMSPGARATVFRGQGDGTFVPAGSYPAGPSSDSVGGFALAAADLNHDQIPDIVMGAAPAGILVALGAQAAMVARRGNGDGSFGPEMAIVGGSIPSFVAVADLDGDGTPDLASVAPSGQSVTVRHGNGDGTFGSPQELAVIGTPNFVMVTDWNGDGIPDLLAGDTYVHLLLGTGNGGFAPAIECGLNLVSTESPPTDWPVLADFDHDGLVDLAINNTVLFGMQECNFTKQAVLHVPYDSMIPMTAGDFNGDGALDLAVAGWNGIGFVAGDGRGNFGDLVTLGDLDAVHGVPISSTGAAGDLNGDGRLDFVVANQYSVRAFMNTCK